jgi:hypothetical protein
MGVATEALGALRNLSKPEMYYLITRSLAAKPQWGSDVV